MDINILITRFHNSFNSSKKNIATIIQAHLKIIIDSIIQRCEEGHNSFIYEIITLNNKDIEKIRNELISVFPDMVITISGKRLIIDWS